MTQRLLGIAVVTASMLALAGCGSPDSAQAAEKGKSKAEQVSDAEREAAPPPPKDFIRSWCTTCSCRVFMGDGGYCSRPSCKHHWKDHQRPPQE